MDKNTSLLFDPPHILPPDVELRQNVLKCENCGKVLTSRYYILFGIPPSSLIVEAFLCERIYDENYKVISIMENINREAKEFEIESKNQWIFSKQNILSSKIRACIQCLAEYTRPHTWNPSASSVRIRMVFLAVKEYQRRHTPIEPSLSEYEKYKISLPDRATIYWKHYGDTDVRDNEDRIMWSYFHDDMQESLRIALIPDYKNDLYDTSTLLQEFKTNFIQSKNRQIPNDQELTRWMKKQINDPYSDYDSFYDKRIHSCKTFMNPKTYEYPVYRYNEKEVYNTKYKVIVHYSIPEGDWEEYNI